MALSYEYVKGNRQLAVLVWIPKDKHLYVRHIERGGKTEYICYQKILFKQEKLKKSSKMSRRDNSKCTARIKIDANGKCSRNNIAHTSHNNHEFLYKDIVSKNEIIDRCVAIKQSYGGIPVKVPVHDVFTVELAK